ncbi:hypothetical protein RZS28_17350 [Methylocapsa polymorpha]|uniref:Uncharacterized protein n=1 Tax=Methylocapsa polymorpha TaxID=3080828 RepID=A0ABZ0HSK8_9HYPH|nr:hypothetical protein RZS28_17350 [Methylocapsa sp. RX1]
MNEMLKRGGACGSLLVQSKFETPQLGLFVERSVHAQLGVRLRKAYELPASNTEPPAIRALLRQIEAKFDGRR